MMNRINQGQIISSKTYDMVTDQDKNLWTPMGIYVGPLQQDFYVFTTRIASRDRVGRM